ncbi:flagellar basal-body rod protein FlgG [Isachenkonia alkalipeptolytica]|uniref:Flagellar basal-body rod protein FlgG n=1 Tax=Isachenkonia alkalipeptolytica TaxID=2565777 RepID=A0AA43XL03_9CLOT|nr:flagellar basal-body rod protein FlgG [Isachenkonia alkalipeptolytica]NBG88321.1 flagellar basal-body rod protein FlgG [Isachenkonia alkalipeptolytica]
MRALSTAATGMKSQQTNIDVISNNLANINTTGYKRQKAEFKDLLYANLRGANVNEAGEGEPNGLEVGHGVRPSSVSRFFTQGTLERTENPFDLALDGRGFFGIGSPDGEPLYTRDGSFKYSAEGDVNRLVTANGYSVLDENDDPIFIPGDLREIIVQENGLIQGVDENGATVDVATLKLVDFINPEGLEAQGGNNYAATVASGGEAPVQEGPQGLSVRQSFLEASNVQAVDEMTRMITAQRAYETSSKAVQTSDEMMGIANNMRR